ncbi:TlpA disulfide reductase family protein [Butyricimonas sp.]|uniref:TlpA family protein disulfide reductase n=1 Tax=Butyricimonas sp. TaxID=1969738 RepID=UPI0025C3D70A|nr:TlpA disulfide reductase family protein [Butyricimonas sp.]
MKKIIVIILLLGVGVVACAQSFTRVAGFVKDDRLREVCLYQVEDGVQKVYATTAVAKDGSYGFFFKPEYTGFYTLGSERMDFPIFIKGGEEVNIDILENRAELNGKNTKENISLYCWEDFASGIRLKSIFFMESLSDYRDFFPEFETFVSRVDAYKAKVKSGNSKFDVLLRSKIDYDVDYYAVMFLQTPRTIHPERKDWPEYYRTIISEEKFSTDEVLQFPDGVRRFQAYATFAFSQSGKPYTGPEEYADICMEVLHDDRLKGEFALDNVILKVQSYDRYQQAIKKYGKYFVTDSQKARAEAVGSKLYDSAPGNIAADFTYPDKNGKDVSLSDFKGKVILVDVWATWCNPCRAEIPHLKRLEEEMCDTDIVFLGVSVDKAKDQQKWLDFIKQEQLGGIQLFASGWGKITKDYKINGIPRFMVFDKNGNIVSIDAPRPSSSELKKMLEAELKK